MFKMQTKNRIKVLKNFTTSYLKLLFDLMTFQKNGLLLTNNLNFKKLKSWIMMTKLYNS